MEQNNSELTRRDFIRQGIFAGLTLAVALPVAANGKRHFGSISNPVTGSTSGGTELLSWISIDTAGQVTLKCNRSEMGQGTFQALPQILAEELEVDPAQIQIVFAPADPQKFGPSPTQGSFSVRGWADQLLRTGAAARQMLITTAATRWRVPVDECYAVQGEVLHSASGRKLGYGALTEAAAMLTPPEKVELKPRSTYKLIGKPTPRQDIPLKVNGSAIFGLDLRLPGMRYAVVERNPMFRGKVKSFDATRTLNVTGVTHVFKVTRAVFSSQLEGVAVVATSLWAAMQGRKLLRVEWDNSGFDHANSTDLAKQMTENLHAPAKNPSFEKALSGSASQIEAVYETPYQSHSCMEPLNCIADVRSDRAEIWGPLQEARSTQADLSERLGIPIGNVAVHMTFLGGGFGRKAFTDYPHEAALISREINAPVQVMWTREDDMSLGPFRPGAMYACRGGIDAGGRVHALQIITATQWIGQEWSPEPFPAPGPPTFQAGEMESLLKPYYSAIPNHSFAGVGARSVVPVMWWRSVSASTNGFAGESFIDELAHAAGTDPLLFRRNHLPDPRYQALIDQLEKVSNWKNSEKGWGIAITECFGGLCGHVVKVSRKADGKLKIDKVTAVMDCGWYVNPDTIRAQVEGSIVMALGAAIKHETIFRDGVAVHKNFDGYPMPRISDIPEIEVHVAENNEPPGGVGEPGLPPFAPALCNAIFDLTGKRIRKLPFNLEEV